MKLFSEMKNFRVFKGREHDFRNHRDTPNQNMYNKVKSKFRSKFPLRASYILYIMAEVNKFSMNIKREILMAIDNQFNFVCRHLIDSFFFYLFTVVICRNVKNTSEQR
jgi:hypothetical protein